MKFEARAASVSPSASTLCSGSVQAGAPSVTPAQFCTPPLLPAPPFGVFRLACPLSCRPPRLPTSSRCTAVRKSCTGAGFQAGSRGGYSSNRSNLGSRAQVSLARRQLSSHLRAHSSLAPRREPFVSLARIFLAVGISPLESLLLYPELRRPAFDSTLAGIAPCEFVCCSALVFSNLDVRPLTPRLSCTTVIDIWVPLKTARTIAENLGVLDELAGLLEWETRRAFSVEDREEGGMVHK